MQFCAYSIDDLRESEKFLGSIRWDMTPKRFLAPEASKAGETKPGEGLITYMLYVDLMYDKPALMIMKLRGSMSMTIGFIEGVPDDLLKEAVEGEPAESGAGMFPLTDRLERWLKEKLGRS
jgi:hypothetical protein